MRFELKQFEKEINFDNLDFLIIKDQQMLRKWYYCFKSNEYKELLTNYNDFRDNEIYFIDSLFSFNLNDRALLGWLEKYLTKAFKKDIDSAILKVSNITSDFANEIKTMLEFDINTEIEITPKEFLKLLNNSFLEFDFNTSMIERVLYIAKVLKELCNLKILVLFMPFTYFNLTDLCKLKYELKQVQIDVILLDINEIEIDKNNSFNRVTPCDNLPYKIQEYILDGDLFSLIK